MRLILPTGILFAAAPAVAAPTALDYAASDASCIDGPRFSDEVSAKLGFVPWDPTAAAKIRVRVERDGDHFTGTFRNVDGNAKIIDGTSCGDVTASLVVTVATAVDRAPKPVTRAPEPPARAALAASADGQGVPVTFRSAEGRRISVAVQKAGGYGVASNGVAVATAYLENLCTSPCTAGLASGRSYLTFSDPDDGSFGGDNYLIDRPTTLTLTHESRRGTRLGLLIGGGAAAGLGALWISTCDVEAGSCVGPILGGSAGLSLGLSAMLVSLWVHDTFSVSQAP
jgi:hypothetical protein